MSTTAKTRDRLNPTDDIVCLLGPNDPDDHFAGQQSALDALPWRCPAETDDEAWAAAAQESLAQIGAGPSIHLIANGEAVSTALRLTATAPQTVTSLQLVDPVVDTDDPDLRDAMRQVASPTLVLVAAPDRETTFSQAQSIAGDVPNGVMVIIDEQSPPVHQTSRETFHEWVTAFMVIAEGLFDLRL